jgi:tetratricopeptide (TPR) repeat protein
MKSDRRHELKHNELSDWIGEQMATLQPHATAVLLGAAILFAAVIGSIWYFGGEDRIAAAGWTRYFSAVNDREPAKVLEKLVSQKSSSKAEQWAHQAMGDMQLGQGAAMLHTDRSEAQKLLQKAEAEYKQIENAADPMLKARARLGLAKVYESLCKPDEARKYYELAAEASSSSAIKKAAAADAQRLKDSRQVAFLEWFAKQQPKRPAPMSGFGGGLPGLPSLPDRPDISPPTGLGLDNLGAGLPGEATPAFPAPASATPPATSTDNAKPEATEPAPKSGEAKTTVPNSDDPKSAETKPE